MNKSGKWVLVSLISVLLGIVLYVIVVDITRTEYDTDRVSSHILDWMPLAMTMLAISFVLSIIATVKVRRFLKIITILLAIVAVAGFMMAWFAYALSQPIY